MTSDGVTPLRIAVAGAGYFAQFHHDGWQRIRGVRIVGIADLDIDRARASAAMVGSPPVFASVAAMLDAAPCDVLDIATPPATHGPLSRLGLQRGLTVVCQKPFCTSLEEARETAALVADAPDRLIVHENFRFQPWYRTTKAILDAGELGDVYQITFRMRPGDGQGPNAYLARQPYFQKMPRFLIRETGIHFIDTFRYLFGEIASVSADLRRLNPAIVGEDAALVTFQHVDGRRGVFDANRLADHPADDRRKTMGEMWIEGSAATLHLDGFARLRLRRHGSNTWDDVSFDWQDRGYGGDCVHLFLAHVAAHLRTGSAIETRAVDYLRNLEIEAAIYRSHAERREVAVLSEA